MTKTFAIAAAAAALLAVSTGASFASPCNNNGYVNYTPAPVYTPVYTYVVPKKVIYLNTYTNSYGY